MTPHLLFESALRASVLGLGVWGLLRLLKVCDPARERLAWLVVLIAGVAMPLVAMALAVMPFAPMPLAAMPFAAFSHRILPGAAVIVELPSATRALFSALDAASRSLPVPTHWAGGFRNLLWPLYLSVTAVLLVRLGVGLIALSRLWRGATPLPELTGEGVRVRSSARIGTPVTIAAGILLPADWTRWSSDARARVLAHETSHFMRGDFFWQFLARAYLAVFWASPLSWWLVRRLALLAEHLSDDAAVAAHGGPVDYAALLLEFSCTRRTAFLTVGMARRSQMYIRAERILRTTGLSASALAHAAVNEPRPARTAARLVGRVAFLTGLLVLAVLSASGPWFSAATSQATSGPKLGGMTSGTSRLPALTERLGNLEALERNRPPSAPHGDWRTLP